MVEGAYGSCDGVVLHVAHGHQPVNACNTHPVQRVWHQRLEPHVHHTRDVLCAVEVLRRSVTTLLPLTTVVHQVLGDFTQRAALLAVVYDQTSTAIESNDTQATVTDKHDHKNNKK